MLKVTVIGASGYTGAELARLLSSHPNFELSQLYVSQNSRDRNKSLSSLYPSLTGQVDLELLPLGINDLTLLANEMDAVFLATPHQASHDWATELVGKKATIFDLSGAFRLSDLATFAEFYGFEHQHPDLVTNAVYGLAEFNHQAISSAELVAVPGCYPTASLLALKPLIDQQLIDNNLRPIINAVSGVSGAGRKAALNSSFCEVSLQAYGVLSHRHQPEIIEHLTESVIFTPHLGAFKRGILATITVKVKQGVTSSDIEHAYHSAYSESPIVRLLDHFPRLQDVVGTPHCDLHFKLDAQSGYVVIGSAIDNLLKGAASQAVQCANLRFGYPPQRGLLGSQNP